MRSEFSRPAKGESPWTRLASGLVLLAAGVILWLDQLDRINAREYLQWWPAALIFVGLAHLPPRRWAAAAGWMIVGLFFLLPKLGVPISPWRLIGLWPLLISVAGVTLIMQALRPRTSGLMYHTTAVMAGNTLTLGSQELGGIDAVAVMGGCEIDLGASRPQSGEVVIHVLAFWGGIEIRVPDGWNVVGEVAEILGGFENTTLPGQPNAPRVVIRGAAIMGGVEVSNSPVGA